MRLWHKNRLPAAAFERARKAAASAERSLQRVRDRDLEVQQTADELRDHEETNCFTERILAALDLERGRRGGGSHAARGG